MLAYGNHLWGNGLKFHKENPTTYRFSIPSIKKRKKTIHNEILRQIYKITENNKKKTKDLSDELNRIFILEFFRSQNFLTKQSNKHILNIKIKTIRNSDLYMPIFKLLMKIRKRN